MHHEELKSTAAYLKALSRPMIKVGDTIRIVASGKFHGQEKEVLKINVRKNRTAYLVNVVWPEPEQVRPSWFEASEIEPVQREEQNNEHVSC